MTIGPDPAFAASPSSPCGSRPSGLQSGVGPLARLVRAATNVAGAETDAPNFEAFLFELQQAVVPFEGMATLPPVGTPVRYFNPAYAPQDNEHTGVGPYAAIVTRAWEYADSRMCNLAVVTPGKDALPQVRSVPERGSPMDDGKYPSWEVIEPTSLYAAAETFLSAWTDAESTDAEARAAIALGRALRAASGTSGSAQDAQRLDPKGAGPVREAETPNG